MNRYKLHDRKVHDGQKFNYRTGERWAVLDTETNRIVDEGITKYEAQQAVKNWNAGLHDDEVDTRDDTDRLVETLNTEGPLRGLVERTPERLVTAQDTATARVLVTYAAPDGRQTTERVSIHLADLLRAHGLGDYDSSEGGR